MVHIHSSFGCTPHTAVIYDSRKRINFHLFASHNWFQSFFLCFLLSRMKWSLFGGKFSQFLWLNKFSSWCFSGKKRRGSRVFKWQSVLLTREPVESTFRVKFMNFQFGWKNTVDRKSFLPVWSRSIHSCEETLKCENLFITIVSKSLVSGEEERFSSNFFSSSVCLETFRMSCKQRENSFIRALWPAQKFSHSRFPYTIFFLSLCCNRVDTICQFDVKSKLEKKSSSNCVQV